MTLFWCVPSYDIPSGLHSAASKHLHILKLARYCRKCLLYRLSRARAITALLSCQVHECYSIYVRWQSLVLTMVKANGTKSNGCSATEPFCGGCLFDRRRDRIRWKKEKKERKCTQILRWRNASQSSTFARRCSERHTFTCRCANVCCRYERRQALRCAIICSIPHVPRLRAAKCFYRSVSAEQIGPCVYMLTCANTYDVKVPL